MDCEEGQPLGESDNSGPALSFWQKLGPRVVALVALIGPATAVFLTQDRPSRPELIQSVRDIEPATPTGYAIETTKAAAERTPVPSTPVTVDMSASAPPTITDPPASLRLATKPAGATFALYDGIIASKTPPVHPPVYRGTSPGTVAELHTGSYTIFFHKDGWPDSRTEIKIQAGEARPVEYSFPHGEVTITSVPSGAEILHGGVSLGFTPLTVDLPSGEQTLTARLKNYPDRTQNVTVDENATPTISFGMRERRRMAKGKRTPPPSLFEKVGGSLRHLFGPNPTPAPRRKR
ncbi:MAG: hypothetical protein DMF04_04490 [Verrucomicrobia bacterium]|nr:MAG: hypothetical protein DMF04_04490 [Verrucomicrobiota bacterium]